MRNNTCSRGSCVPASVSTHRVARWGSAASTNHVPTEERLRSSGRAGRRAVSCALRVAERSKVAEATPNPRSVGSSGRVAVQAVAAKAPAPSAMATCSMGGCRRSGGACWGSRMRSTQESPAKAGTRIPSSRPIGASSHQDRSGLWPLTARKAKKAGAAQQSENSHSGIHAWASIAKPLSPASTASQRLGNCGSATADALKSTTPTAAGQRTMCQGLRPKHWLRQLKAAPRAKARRKGRSCLSCKARRLELGTVTRIALVAHTFFSRPVARAPRAPQSVAESQKIQQRGSNWYFLASFRQKALSRQDFSQAELHGTCSCAVPSASPPVGASVVEPPR
ncbi:MAG: hypothetical protein ACI9VR_001343 [Cognaticolwellia sp.]|jgi:hypothetical protein